MTTNNSFFNLELDTTPPKIEIYMPTYTINNIPNDITIQADEVLAYYQDIYFIDSRGNRHDMVFTHDGDKYIGKVVFNNFSIGIATMYARLRDDVFNLSELVSKTINIMPSDSVKTHIDINDLLLNMVDIESKQRNIEIGSNIRKVKIASKSRTVKIKSSSNGIDILEEL